VTELIPIPSPGVPLLFGEPGAPVVVVVHDWYGRLPWLTPYAEALAGRGGFRVIVPDLYDGAATDDDRHNDEADTWHGDLLVFGCERARHPVTAAPPGFGGRHVADLVLPTLVGQGPQGTTDQSDQHVTFEVPTGRLRSDRCSSA